MSSFIKNKTFNYLTVILMAVIVGLGVIVKLQHNKIDVLTYLEKKWKNNFALQLLDARHWKSKYGNLVVSSVSQSLGYEDAIYSKDEEIERLTKYADKLGIKVKDLQYLLSIQCDTIVDTVIKTRIVSVPEVAEVRYHDTLYLGNSAVYRVMNADDSTSHYIAELGGTLNVYYEPEQKQGKWRIKNLFVAREKRPVISISSGNPLISYKNVKLVVVEKRKIKPKIKPISGSMSSF